MAERFLEPNVPLKKIDNETGDTLYIYPQTTASQVKMDEDGTRLSTILTENIVYFDKEQEDAGSAIINADTLGGLRKEDFVTAENFNNLEIVEIDLDSAGTDVGNNTSIFDLVYPVGSIYMSVTLTNPSILFGGTWERIKDTFLLSAGDKYSAGTIGGEATHTLTIEEMPSHKHNFYYKFDDKSNDAVSSQSWSIVVSNIVEAEKDNGAGMYDTGGSQPHNNMPPYLAVYMWKRTA